MPHSKKRLQILIFVFLLLAIPITVILALSRQEIRKKATDNLLNSRNINFYIDELNNSDLTKIENASNMLLTNPQLATPYLISRLQKDPPIAVKGQITFLLGKIKSKKAIPELIKILDSNNSYLTINALIALEQIKDPTATPYILRSLSHKDEEVRREAALVLSIFNNKEVVENLIKQLEKEDANGVKVTIASSLGKLKDKKATPILIYELNLSKTDKTYKDAIITALGNIGDAIALASLKEHLNNINQLITQISPSEDPLIKGQLEITKRLLEEAIEKIDKNH